MKKRAVLLFILTTFASAFAGIYANRIINYMAVFVETPILSDCRGGKMISFEHKKDSVYFSIDGVPFSLYHDEIFYIRKSCRFDIYYKYGFFKSWTIRKKFDFLTYLNDMFAKWAETGDYSDLDHYLCDETEIYFGNQFACWEDCKYSKNMDMIGKGLVFTIINVEYKNESSVLTGIQTPKTMDNVVIKIIAK